MAERSNTTGLFVALAIFLAGGLGGAGYAGFLALEKKIDALPDRTRRVIVDLNADLIGELKAGDWGKSTAADQTDAARDEKLGRDIRDTLAQLKSSIDTVVTRQNAIESALAKDDAATVRDGDIKRTVFFNLNEIKGDDVNEQVTLILHDLVGYNQKPWCEAAIDGYSDTLGRDITNLKLSRERADYVAAKVRAAGIKVASVMGWGERRLDVQTLDGVKNERNRRVEIDIVCGRPKNNVASDTTGDVKADATGVKAKEPVSSTAGATETNVAKTAAVNTDSAAKIDNAAGN